MVATKSVHFRKGTEALAVRMRNCDSRLSNLSNTFGFPRGGRSKR